MFPTDIFSNTFPLPTLSLVPLLYLITHLLIKISSHSTSTSSQSFLRLLDHILLAHTPLHILSLLVLLEHPIRELIAYLLPLWAQDPYELLPGTTKWTVWFPWALKQAYWGSVAQTWTPFGRRAVYAAYDLLRDGYMRCQYHKMTGTAEWYGFAPRGPMCVFILPAAKLRNVVFYFYEPHSPVSLKRENFVWEGVMQVWDNTTGRVYGLVKTVSKINVVKTVMRWSIVESLTRTTISWAPTIRTVLEWVYLGLLVWFSLSWARSSISLTSIIRRFKKLIDRLVLKPAKKLWELFVNSKKTVKKLCAKGSKLGKEVLEKGKRFANIKWVMGL